MDSTLPALFHNAASGDASAKDALFTALYNELHRIARRELARQGRMTLGATTLLHEAYIEIAQRQGTSFPDRAQFMGYASRVMRGLIIDHSRRRRALKRGGQYELTALDLDPASPGGEAELTGISDALDELASVEPELAQLVDLKFFCGFTFLEIGAMRGVGERTVQRHWEKARIYLHRTLRSGWES